jgi:two-component system sensor histidine kinase CiaH
MMEESKRKLRLTTLVYWVLLFYIIAALVWWFLSLYQQNETMYALRRQNLIELHGDRTPAFQKSLAEIEDSRRRNQTKYIGEGATFFLLIMVGAVFLYRSVRRQFRAQQQQQNFVMAITHELKTPISVARLNLETLLRYQLDEEKKAKFLNMTLQEILRLDNLINNILIASQLDGRSYKMSHEELNFSDLVTDALHQFKVRYSDREVMENLQPDIDLNGDPLLLKLLVSNLLENANKYSPKDKAIELILHERGSIPVLEVIDQGCGISEEEKKNIFKKFYRVGNEETRTTKGTGLGLYLCKKIAEDHNGMITVSDNQPQGSKFTVQFSD